jgi:hypothetical protein
MEAFLFFVGNTGEHPEETTELQRNSRGTTEKAGAVSVFSVPLWLVDAFFL